jgi:hypothetical protein
MRWALRKAGCFHTGSGARTFGLAALALIAALVASPAIADVALFKTPSGNIECSVGTGEGPSDIECVIFEHSGPSTAPRPAGCSVWGYQFSMRGRGVVAVGCGRPEARAAGSGDDIAQYGRTGRFGDIVCRSSTRGLDCRNADGHGFFLSRRLQSVF